MLKIPARFKQCDLSVSLAFDYCDCIVNMGTRAAAFTAKIRSLYDYQLRLMQGILPPPSGVDIANTIKYFTQTLLGVLKDVPNSPYELLKNPEMDTMRMGLFPSLDYKGLYNSVVPLIEVAPLITNGLHVFGQAVLQCLGCMLPFLEHDLIDNLPYLTASTIAVLPPSLHQEIINYLCFHILPFTIVRHDLKKTDISHSVSAVIIMIFQYSFNPAHHCQLLECLMAHKPSILKDILGVIAYGTSTSRATAAKLLFYYWPTFNTELFDRKNLICKIADPAPFVCQRDDCPNAGNAEAAKVCYNHTIAISYSNDIPPPLYLCIECANEIHKEHPNTRFFDMLHHMQQVSMVCENKNCRSSDKSAISVCFATECASYNGNHPIRYCEQCHSNRHNQRRGIDHIYHKAIPSAWDMDKETQTYMVETIVSLFKEAKIPMCEPKEGDKKEPEEKFENKKEGKELGREKDGKSPIPAIDNIGIEERQLLGRYGVWLLVGRCRPDEPTPVEVLGRLLAMVFHWFHMTLNSYDGNDENSLENLKSNSVKTWLRDVSKTHYNLFISCLLPHPPDYAQIGGNWDTLSTRTTHLKEGLDRLFCLVPYDVLTQETWDYIMPHWMEAIVNGVPDKEMCELKETLSRILDPEMNPIGSKSHKMYQFVTLRFYKTNAKVQQQALKWLQAITLMDVYIPLEYLFIAFNDGISFLKQGEGESETIPIEQPIDMTSAVMEHKQDLYTKEDIHQCNSSSRSSITEEENIENLTQHQKDIEDNLFCCVVMLDVLLRQMELQEVDKHTGLSSILCKNVCRLLKMMITTAWINSHVCSSKSECSFCECSIMWHQLAYELIMYLTPTTLAHPPDPPSDAESSDDAQSRKSPPDSDKKEKSTDVVLSIPVSEPHSVGGVLVHMPHVCSIMTATVETVSEQLDLISIMPTEKAFSAVARAITLSETDIAAATVSVAAKQPPPSPPSIVAEANDNTDVDSDDEDMEFYETSLGKFKFSVNDLPEPIQYIHQLLQELSRTLKSDVLYCILKCLNVLVLYGDAFTKVSKDHKGFFIWCQENMVIKSLWDMLKSEHSQICQEAVPLLLHCITLPAGPEVFWRIIQNDFHNHDWRVRFTAVEKVTVLARFMADCPLKNQVQLQAALANAFCYLVSSMDDNNIYVAQRATLYLGTIHDYAIKSLILCFETQFDSVILDRPMVLQCIYQLHNSMSERKILNWDFFLNRFDALFIEAQIALEKMGDISYIRDLRNSDCTSEAFIKKLQKAQDALAGVNEESLASSIKTLSASFGTKWPYKRTMSAPASIIRHQESKSDSHMHTLNTIDDQQNISTFLQRVVDLEEADKETMHLLVFLLMQFLSRPDQAYTTDERHLSRTQAIVIKHLWLLLGYSQTDRMLYLPPQNLRSSPAFTAFISSLPQVMDQNQIIGKHLLPNCLIILQYAPSPYYMQTAMEFQTPLYTLWSLEPSCRRNWLISLVVLLYKYQYSQQPYSFQLIALIRIVMNCLESQHHHCRRLPTSLLIPQDSSRSRDVSQPSLGTEIDHPDRTTPPLSPMYSSDGQSIQVSVSSKAGKVQISYAKPSSTTSMETHWEEENQLPADKKTANILKKQTDDIDDDDSESELIAIPETDISDSTLQGSIPDSLEERICKQLIENVISNQSPQNSNSSLIETPKCSKNRPTWIIGSEDDSIHSYDNKLQEMAIKSKMDFNKNFPNKIKLGSSKSPLVLTNSNGGLALQTAKTVTTTSHRQVTSTSTDTVHNTKLTTMAKYKRMVESSSTITDIFENNHKIFHTPSLERLLPVGPIYSPDLDDVFLSVEAELDMPNQERLLPIGQNTKDITQLVERVKQALCINSQLGKLAKKSTSSDNQSPNNSGSQPNTSQSHSPRKLIKQVALESPPNMGETEDKGLGQYLQSTKLNNRRDVIVNHRQRIRKAGPFAMNSHYTSSPKKPGFWTSPSLSPKPEENEDKKLSMLRTGEKCVKERCPICGFLREIYTDEEIGLCIVALGTFIHREPGLAAPLLPEILNVVSRVLLRAQYPWQKESNIYLPGGALSVGHQFFRCILHQLAPNGIFLQLFQTKVSDKIRTSFFRNVIQSLVDFSELNPLAPLHLLLETLNSKKALPVEVLPVILQNMATYLSCLPLEAALGSSSQLWCAVLQQLEALFRKILLVLNILEEINSLLHIIASIFRLPLITQFKGMLDPFSKILSYAVQNHTIKYNILVEICYLCHKAFLKDRDKLILSRMLVMELIQVLKFKICIPYANLIMLVNLILQDVGGSVSTNILIMDNFTVTTGIAECMKIHLADILEFLSDFHSISKLKIDQTYRPAAAGIYHAVLRSNPIFEYNFMRPLQGVTSYSKETHFTLNDDTIGGIVKCSFAQYLAIEITKGNGRDNRAVTKYLPWLYHQSPVNQQSQKDFLDAVTHVRLLSWLLLGSLTHTVLQSTNPNQTNTTDCQPIPQEASCQIADNVQIIMSGFTDQSKASVLHMSSLFHTFILCQLWTVYLEQGLVHHAPVTDAYNTTMNVLFDFWGKVSPCILQLIQQSNKLSEIVSLHFLSMLEALIECQSTFVSKLLPLWMPILLSNHIQLPGHLQVRLQSCRNFPPAVYRNSHLAETTKLGKLNNLLLLKWLRRLQFKMGQIELQSLTTTQFYSL